MECIVKSKCEGNCSTIDSSVIAKALGINSLRNNCFGSIRVKLNLFSSSLFIPRLVRFINRYFYKLFCGASLCRYDSSLTLYSSRHDSNLYSGYPDNSIFCNFGSGAFYHPKWINYDFPAQSPYYMAVQGKAGVDFYPIDLCREDLRLPYKDGSVSLIYCSHTLEHLEETKGVRFIRECARILASGGVMRVVVPFTDFNLYRTKMVCIQSEIPADAKKATVLASSSYLFSPVKGLGEDVLTEALHLSDFDAVSFIKKMKDERSLCDRFNGDCPEMHIAHWNHQKFAELSKQLGFSFYLPVLKGSSVAPPFSNIDVFDTTEPHLSIYGEFIK